MYHAQSGTMTAVFGSVIDTRVDMKLSRFSGIDEDLSDGCLRFEVDVWSFTWV